MILTGADTMGGCEWLRVFFGRKDIVKKESRNPEIRFRASYSIRVDYAIPRTTSLTETECGDVKGGNVEDPPLQSVYTFESVGQDTSKRRNITGMTVNSTRDSNKPSPTSLSLSR